MGWAWGAGGLRKLKCNPALEKVPARVTRGGRSRGAVGATAQLAGLWEVKVCLHGDSLGKTQTSKRWRPDGRLNDGPKDVQALIPRTFRYVTSYDKETLQRGWR